MKSRMNRIAVGVASLFVGFGVTRRDAKAEGLAAQIPTSTLAEGIIAQPSG